MAKPITFKEEPYAGESPPAPSKWMPEPNLMTHQIVGKLGEEAAELAQICFRILIQGMTEKNPDNDKLNLHALVEEISDVRAMLRVLESQLGTRPDIGRENRKYALKLEWMESLQRDNP